MTDGELDEPRIIERKWCGRWVRVHMNELRRGDHFRIYNYDGSLTGCFNADSDPYPWVEKGKRTWGITGRLPAHEHDA